MWPWGKYYYKYEVSHRILSYIDPNWLYMQKIWYNRSTLPLLSHIFRYPIFFLVIINTFHDVSSTVSGRIKTAEVLVEIFYCLYFSKSKDRKIKLRVSKHIWSCEFLFFINTAIKIYCGCLLLGVMILFVSLTHFDIISIVGRSIESDRSQRFFQEFVYGIECEVPKSEEAWCNQMIDNKLYNFSLIYISAKRWARTIYPR